MTPETEDLLAKARADIEDARKILSLPLPAISARSAYYAAFHAAEALIFERTGKVAKTHSGVRTMFARLIGSGSRVDKTHLSFLTLAYKYKQISDYGVDPNASVGAEEASEALVAAEYFIARVADLISNG